MRTYPPGDPFRRVAGRAKRELLRCSWSDPVRLDGPRSIGEELRQLSGGKLSINQFPGAQLGTEPQTLQKMRAGDIDFVITSTANASSVAPQAGVFSLHFIFRDEAHLTKVLADKQVADAFRAMVKDSVQGGQVLSLLTMGFRNMYAKREITKVEDIKGLKIRVQATKTEDTHFPAYGAQTVHMPFGEVYTSLQTGVVNVAENGVNVYETNKHYEVAPVLNMTQHEANNNCLWVSDKTRHRLSDQEKKWVQEAADEISKREPALALRLEQDSAAKLRKIGVKVVDNADKSGFQKAALPIQDQLAQELGPHAVKIPGLVSVAPKRLAAERSQHKGCRARLGPAGGGGGGADGWGAT